ncbi:MULTISPECIES: methanethiol S-methyltransferase [unclassified Ruegeria]|uniref:methanethiol S-methyltransferase n=1 Tax=unclassified Ruegeria TaxID=2625375 RepID=UPI001487B246|nr:MULTISPECIES: methanethiol S-methyltransferase [unclassified Ruegeria]
MNRPGLILYGAVAYVLFNVAFLYMIGFLLQLPVPKAINDGTTSAWPVAVVINFGLIFLFGFFHSLMARQAFKSWWTRIIPADAERSTYVLQSALFLILAMWQWRPLPETIWIVDGALAWLTYGICALGVFLVLLSTFLIDHFELFGLRQIWTANRSQPMPKPQFRTPGLYRFVRHPMQFGVILVLFGTPHMTVGHALFAGLMMVYVMIGLWFEERSLEREFGDTYRAYQAMVPMLIPRLKPLRSSDLETQHG